jgi:hypothetical protein
MGAYSFATAVASACGPLLDAAGGDYRLVTAASAAVWLALKTAAGRRGRVDWYSLVHAVVAGAGGCMCIYLDAHAAALDPAGLGVPEPLRSVRCAPALTPLHTLLPMVTLGYAAADLLHGVALGRGDFILHGAGLGACFGFVCQLGVPHLVAGALVMDVSSVPLNVLHVAWRSAAVDVLVHVIFAAAFFATRIVVFPLLWYRWVAAFLGEATAPACYPSFFIYAVVGFGLLFHGLNAYWMVLIAKKAARKVTGGSSAGRGMAGAKRE